MRRIGAATEMAAKMKNRTRKLWQLQDRHPGDRLRLFKAIAAAVPARTALYPGSFVDIAPSFVFPSVTYVDSDRRAAAFFADEEGVREIVAGHEHAPRPDFRFIHADYAGDLALQEASFDLLVSLYAGFVSAACTRYLRIGGTLLANPSHGDAAMASIDPRYRLSGVVLARDGDYRVSTDGLDAYLVPKKAQEITAEALHKSGRGIGYTRPAFAYLFQRVR